MKALVGGPASQSAGGKGSALTVGTGMPRKGTDRRLALDAVKGLLVLLMVLYHWLNYFVTREGEIYRYLRFITPAFIFITGFLITNVYLAKYRIGERKLHGKLLVRGLKLVTLFTVLNLGANLLVQKNYDGSELGVARFVANASAIYMSGDGKGAAFEVLVPIGYLLAASSLLLLGCKVHRHFLVGMWLVCLGGVYVLKWTNIGSANLELLSMGLLGMVVGCFPLGAVDRVARLAVAWFAAYGIYLMALSIYDVVFGLQVVGLILNMVLLYIAAKSLGDTGAIARKVIVLGQYSLLAYIAHIAILQVLARAMRPWELGASTYVLSLGGALLLTFLTVTTTVWMRRNSTLADKLYRVVFA